MPYSRHQIFPESDQRKILPLPELASVPPSSAGVDMLLILFATSDWRALAAATAAAAVSGSGATEVCLQDMPRCSNAQPALGLLCSFACETKQCCRMWCFYK